MKKTIILSLMVIFALLTLGLTNANLIVDELDDVNFNHLEESKELKFNIENPWDLDNMSMDINVDDSFNLGDAFFDFDWDNGILENKSNKLITLTMDSSNLNINPTFEGYDGNINLTFNYKNNSDNTEYSKNESFKLFVPAYKRELKIKNDISKFSFEDKNPGDSFTATFYVENIGTITLDSFNVVIEDEDFKEKYGVEITKAEDSIEPKDDVKVDVKITIPEELSTEISKDNTKIIISYADKELEIDLEISTKIMTIDIVEIRADRKRLERILREDYLDSSSPYFIREDAKIGDEIEITVYIKNNFPTDDRDNELRDVEIELFSFDLVDADGMEEFISRIRPGRSEEVKFTFFLDPRELYSGDAPYDIEIRVTGETRDNNVYTDSWFLDLDVESSSYNLLMYDIRSEPNPVCAGDRVRIELDLFNIGTRDLEEAGLYYYSSSLDIEEWDTDIEIYEEDRKIINKYLNIPNNANPGEYNLKITAFPRHRSSRDTVSEDISITVRECGVSTTTTTTVAPVTTTTTLAPILPPGQQTGPNYGTFPVVEEKSKFTETDTYIALLVGIFVIFVILTILLAVYLFKK